MSVSSQKPTILIVDDEQAVCDLLSEELTEHGYLCDIALDGSDALRKFSSRDFAVVLLDIRLPGMGGIDVLRQIRQKDDKVVVIIITAATDLSVAVDAMKLGASDYIVKPFDFDKVDAAVKAALERSYAAGSMFTEIDSIAGGIEARLTLSAALSRTVIEETVPIARKLGISSKTIQKWVAARHRSDLQRDAATKLLAKLEGKERTD